MSNGPRGNVHERPQQWKAKLHHVSKKSEQKIHIFLIQLMIVKLTQKINVHDEHLSCAKLCIFKEQALVC